MANHRRCRAMKWLKEIDNSMNKEEQSSALAARIKE